MCECCDIKHLIKLATTKLHCLISTHCLEHKWSILLNVHWIWIIHPGMFWLLQAPLNSVDRSSFWLNRKRRARLNHQERWSFSCPILTALVVYSSCLFTSSSSWSFSQQPRNILLNFLLLLLSILPSPVKLCQDHPCAWVCACVSLYKSSFCQLVSLILIINNTTSSPPSSF